MDEAKHPFPAEPMKILFTRGTDREIGRQHAEGVGDWVSRGMVRFYHEFWQRVLSPAMPASTPLDRLQWMAAKAGVKRLLARLVRGVPDHARERLAGISEASGEPIEKLQTLLVLPDLFPMMQAWLARFLPSHVVPPRLPTFGCSTFLSKGDRFLVGRNLDFPGVAYWDRFPVVQLTAREGCLKYIGFTSGGVPIAGITGINEAQIYVALHQHYATPTNIRGELPFVIAEEVLSHARTLDDALDRLRRSKVVTAWAFVVADGKTGDGFILETHAGRQGLRRVADAGWGLAHTNHFQTAECRVAEYAATGRMNWDNSARRCRLETLVSGAGPSLSPEQAVRFISDHFDPFWEEEKIFNRTVSQVFNLQSLVLDPVSLRAWVAEGDAPIHLGRYRELDLAAIFDGKTGVTENFLNGYEFQDPRNRAAKQWYIGSFIEAMDGRLESALTGVKRALDETFVPEAALTGAVVSMKLGDFSGAATLLERAIAALESKMAKHGKIDPPPELHECRFFLARAHDLLGRRAEALRLYRLLSSDRSLEDGNLRRITLKEEVYTPRKLERILAPYSAYIPFQ